MKLDVLSASEEIRGTVELLHSEGAVETDDRRMLGGVLDLEELEVSDVMVHRTKIATIDADLPPRGDRARGAGLALYPPAALVAGRRRTSSACCTPRTCCARSTP